MGSFRFLIALNFDRYASPSPQTNPATDKWGHEHFNDGITRGGDLETCQTLAFEFQHLSELKDSHMFPKTLPRIDCERMCVCLCEGSFVT